tara:strand:- start:113 stop:322 length:210 start_codon:yes stop_codon:yes gene_type:complete
MAKKSVKLTPSETVLDDVYKSLYRYGCIRNVHIPHSSVYYIRALIEKDTGVRYTLAHVEQAMKAEGWID